MLPYSAIKKKAKGSPEYSVLYPETSSDSASAKSKGAQFVSATINIKNNAVSKGKYQNKLPYTI